MHYGRTERLRVSLDNKTKKSIFVLYCSHLLVPLQANYKFVERFDRETYCFRRYRSRSILWCQQWSSADDQVAISQTARGSSRQRDTRAGRRGADGGIRGEGGGHAPTHSEV